MTVYVKKTSETPACTCHSVVCNVNNTHPLENHRGGAPCTIITIIISISNISYTWVHLLRHIGTVCRCVISATLGMQGCKFFSCMPAYSQLY